MEEVEVAILEKMEPSIRREVLWDIQKECSRDMTKLERLEKKLQYDLWYFRDVRKNDGKALEKWEGL